MHSKAKQYLSIYLCMHSGFNRYASTSNMHVKQTKQNGGANASQIQIIILIPLTTPHKQEQRRKKIRKTFPRLFSGVQTPLKAPAARSAPAARCELLNNHQKNKSVSSLLQKKEKVNECLSPCKCSRRSESGEASQRETLLFCVINPPFSEQK